MLQQLLPGDDQFPARAGAAEPAAAAAARLGLDRRSTGLGRRRLGGRLQGQGEEPR
ncbi:hypothetical protein [Crossiella cryophila]|uniref:Uncharacterized protein n=1 Tax=Crossiella cryophila TaxID=43355 RepID=A0A7W7CGC6_9PSEU|nr:hypothetical protein [Crossiella cryophila]MBB4680432.1 hypothetical protein [Crossiella cryophila]